MRLPGHLLTRSLLAAALLLAACGGGEEDGGRKGGSNHNKSAPPPLVEAVSVERGTVRQLLVTSGTVESEFQVDLAPETGGVVARVNVEEGDGVSPGQVLATIENPSLEGALARARTDLERAEQAHEEVLHLQEAGAVGQSEVRDSWQRLATARASFDEASHTRAFTRLKSPIAGTVAVRDVRLGETISPGQRAFQVVDLSRLMVVASLPERDLHRVQEGQEALLLPVYDEGRATPAVVTRVAPVVDPATGTFKVTLTPSDPSLRPGQYVSVRLAVEIHEGTLLVPRHAVLFQRGIAHAFRVEDAPEEEEEEGDEEAKETKIPGFLASLFGRDEPEEAEEEPSVTGPRRVARRIDLQTGFMEPDKVEVLGGLEEGDLVVGHGIDTLRDGARVRLPGDPVPGDEPTSGEGSVANGEGG